MLLVRFNVCAQSISFGRALELSQKQVAGMGSAVDSESACHTERLAIQLRVPDVSDRSEVDCDSLPAGILAGVGCQTSLPPRAVRSILEPGCPAVGRSAGSDAVTNTAMEYIQLVWASAEWSARKQQHELARRLVVVERMRARAGVDDDVVLYRAKLLEAQTRMRAASAEAEVLALRQALAAQIGVSEASLEIVPDSVPALPAPAIEDHGDSQQSAASHDRFALLSAHIKELTAARDAAQLAYYLSHRDATRMSASTTATLGDQITSQIRDEEKFGMLLSEIVALQQSELLVLAASGGIEKWASAGEPLTRQSLVSEQGSELPTREALPAQDSTARHWEGKAFVQGVNASIAKASTPSPKLTLMVLPPDSKLAAGDCKQFAAVGIAEGKGKDATSVVKWSSSHESVAIVSTSGLVTAIAGGDAAIEADLDGVSRLVHTTVVDSRH